MTTEATTKHIVLNEGQARFLIDLSRIAADYRGSWQSLIERGQKEINRLSNNEWVDGPGNQVMAEVQQEFGKIKFALNMIWSVFRIDIFEEEKDRRDAAKEIEAFVAIALAENKGKNASLSGGTWFMEGKTIEDYK